MSAETPTIGQVLVPRSFSGPLDYDLTEDAKIGQIVQIPLGKKMAYGAVWGMCKTSDIAIRKSIDKAFPYTLSSENRQFIDWVSAYTMASKGLVLKMMMGIPDLFKHNKPTYTYALQSHGIVQMTDARQRVLSALQNTTMTKRDLCHAANVSPSVIDGLHAKGALSRTEKVDPIPQKPNPRFSPCIFSSEQKKASDILFSATQDGGFSTILLEGITGSGKTEVYFESIAAALSSGQQSLILLPEIALSEQWIDRFKKRFGVIPVIWHSNMSPKNRKSAWNYVITGEAYVVIGTRSALFLPFKNLGSIIVDEEHDSSYKQEMGVLYQARDMAVVRGKIHGCPIILSSATPALETHHNVAIGRYRQCQLKDRHGTAVLPNIRLIDMRGQAGNKQYISPLLVQEIQKNTANGKQSLIFLNRRGYAPLLVCTRCGERLSCPACSTYAVYHRHKNQVRCHHCTYQHPFSNSCTSCGGKTLIPFGPGVERIEEEAKQHFPKSHILLMTSDTLDQPETLRISLRKIHEKQVDIIIGTQIMAKGHHFPDLTLVGIIDADMGLDTMDMRASERTYQLLEQVSGRAGRSNAAGTIYLQTHMPTHPLFQYLKNYDRAGFLSLEMHQREMMQLPPFSRLASIIISSKSPDDAADYAKLFGQHAPHYDNVEILGPALAPLRQRQHWHRWRFLVKSPRDINIQKTLEDWCKSCPIPRAVRRTIDIDPYVFL